MSNARVQALRLHLQRALELELFTIGPYLAALYSIHERQNLAAAQIIQGVVMEEMLHMTLVANVLNAVGGNPRVSPDIAKELRVVEYPSEVPNIDLGIRVSLERFSKSAIQCFAALEKPDDYSSWGVVRGKARFDTIGEFYDALLNELIAVTSDLGEAQLFTGERSRQVTSDYYYGAGGNVTPVFCLADAKDVISQVAQQGEGRRKISNQTGDHERFGQPKEVAHFYRFEQILVGRFYDRDDDVSLEPTGDDLIVDWAAVYPMQPNPPRKGRSPHDIATLLDDFDQAYRSMLKRIHSGFNGNPASLQQGVTDMQRLKRACIALMRVEAGSGTTYGPPFWYVQLQ